MFTVGQDVRVVPALRVGLRGDVFINLPMSELAGQIRNVVSVVGEEPADLYLLEDCPYYWPASALMNPDDPIPEVVEPEAEPEPVTPFKVGDLVRICDNLDEETFGRNMDDFNAGFVGTMREMIGTEATVLSVIESSHNQGFYITMQGVTYSWDHRALELVAAAAEMEEQLKRFKKVFKTENLYRVYDRNLDRQSICSLRIHERTITLTSCASGTMFLTMPVHQFLTRIDNSNLKLVCVEKNV